MSAEFDDEVSKFFETGELTGSLAQEAVTPAVEPAQETPPVTAQPVQQPVQQQPVTDPNIAALRGQLGQLQQYSKTLEDAIKNLQQTGLQPPQQPVAAPDPDTDPLGYTMHELAEVKKMIAAMGQNIQTQQQVQEQTNQLQTFVSTAQEQGHKFIQQTPDFDQAYAYIRGVRVQDMRDMGLNDAQIKEALVREEIQVSAQAMNQGRNPAQFIYEIAKRYGYRPTAQQQDNAAKLEALQKGQQASTQRMQQSAPPVDLSLDSVKSMNHDQLDKLVEADDLWHKVVGGRAAGDSIFH